MSRWQDRLARWTKPPRKLRFTREGRYFVGITLGVGFAAINTGNNLLYLILGMMLALIILSGVLSEISLRHVRVKREPPTRIYASRPFLMSMSVRNAKTRFPSFSIEVEDLVDGEPLDKKCYFLKIPAGRTQETSYRYLFERRGLYRYDGMRISTKFPFALFRKSREADLGAEVLVFPAIKPVPDLVSDDRRRPGEEGDLRKGRGGEFHGLREWRAGDDARDVHWRTSAHAGRLMVREWEVESARRVSVVLNNLRTDDTQDDELEQAVSLAASIADRLLDELVEVELITHTDRVPFARGSQQRWRILTVLALLEFVPADGAVSLEGPAGARRLLVTHEATKAAAGNGFDRVFDVAPARGSAEVAAA